MAKLGFITFTSKTVQDIIGQHISHKTNFTPIILNKRLILVSNMNVCTFYSWRL